MIFAGIGLPVAAEPLVPGTGYRVTVVGDDFEDENWAYLSNDPKSSRELDENTRLPAGGALNGRWYEGAKRGHPDVVRRVPTPPQGLAGSRGSLLLQSLYTGIPQRPGQRLAQDDLVADVSYRLGGPIPVSRSPSVVVRVFLPPAERWEDRSGSHFGFRLALQTTLIASAANAWPPQPIARTEAYWPGIFVEFESVADQLGHDSAWLIVRSDERGIDFRARAIEVTGWWTLGFSVTPDGMVHYYASPGVDPLEPADHLASAFPYGYRAESLRTFFFDVCNGDDGYHWSTSWIVDDAMLYVAR